jgi:RimJ/RimL family protein N-acetyltransferase
MNQFPTCPPRLAPIVLTGRFVRLEPLRREHLPGLTFAALSDPGTWDYMRHRVESAADVERLLEAALAEADEGLNLGFAAIDRRTEELVGSTRYLDYRPADRGVEIGATWYIPSTRGTAVNPEAKLLLLRHAFETLGCMRVQLKTDERNLRSRAAIARLGAREEGTLRKHMVVQGGFARNSVYFSITDDEWPTVEAGLLARLDSASP